MPSALIQDRFDLEFETSDIPVVSRRMFLRDTDIELTDEIQKKLPRLMLRYAPEKTLKVFQGLWAGLRNVDVARRLHIADHEVVRIRKHAARIMRVLIEYDIRRDRKDFIRRVLSTVPMTNHQRVVFELFFSYHGLQDIRVITGMTTPNVHRTLGEIKRRLVRHLQEVDGSGELPFDPFFLNLFQDYRYLKMNGDL